MDPVPPDVKQELEAAASSPLAPPVGTRRYPKPPALGKRLILLGLKPEAWPAAAKYPLWVTLLPLFLAVLIAAAAFATSMTIQVTRGLDSFAATYDARFPELDVNSDGILSVKAPPATLPATTTSEASPIAVHKEPLEFTPGFIVDTTGKTTMQTVKEPFATLITNHQIFCRTAGHDSDPIEIKDAAAEFLPAKGEISRINGSTIRSFLADRRPALITTIIVIAAATKIFSESLWIVLTMFLIFPAVSIGAAIGRTRLFVPKRAAYRIAAAVLVPIVLFSSLTNAAGYSVASVVGPENSMIFWFFSAAALAFWAGYMAKGMFLPKVVRRRTT